MVWYGRIPLVADPTKEISADYGVLIPSLGIALRGLFIINPEGILEQVMLWSCHAFAGSRLGCCWWQAGLDETA